MVLAGMGAATYTGIVSHHGGAMVYQHGVGVPASPNNLKLDLSSPPPASGESDTEPEENGASEADKEPV